MEEQNIENQDITENIQQPLLSDNDISITLSCQIGKVRLSIAQLSKIVVGDVIEFSPWPTTAKLYANDSYLASGELVEVNGMVGVKITSKEKSITD